MNFLSVMMAYGKDTKTYQINHIQESQEISPFPAGDYTTTTNRQDSTTDEHETQITKRIHKISTVLERSVNIFTGVFFYSGAILF